MVSVRFRFGFGVYVKQPLRHIVYCTKISVSLSLYHKEWQFSFHQNTGRNVKDLSLENVLRQIVY